MEVPDEPKPTNVITSILQGNRSPPESLTGSFVKTATAITSCAASLLSHREDNETEGSSSQHGDCLVDPWPIAKGRSDTVTGVIPEKEPPGPCGVEKGCGAGVGGGEDVAVPEVRGGRDEVVVVGGGLDEGQKEGGGACVDGLQGVEIGGEGRENGDNNNGDEGEREQEHGILVEGLV